MAPARSFSICLKPVWPTRRKKKDLSTEWKCRYGNRQQIKLIVPEHRGQTCQSSDITSNDWDVCLDEVCVWFGQALLLELMVSCSCRATSWHLQPASNWPRNSQSQRSVALKCDYFCKVTGKLRIVEDKERLQLKYCKTALKWYSSSSFLLCLCLASDSNPSSVSCALSPRSHPRLLRIISYFPSAFIWHRFEPGLRYSQTRLQTVHCSEKTYLGVEREPKFTTSHFAW